MRCAVCVALAALMLVACRRGGSAESPSTTAEQQAMMKERANEAYESAPPGARISGRHGPYACYERWVYASEESFEKCLFNWRNTEQQRAAGHSRGQALVRAVGDVSQGLSPRRVVCVNRTLSETCTDDNWHQGCCSKHDGMLKDAADNPVFAVGE